MKPNTQILDLPEPALLALDWGTSSLRAFLLDAKGAARQQRETPWGIQHLPSPANAGGFDQAFEAIAADWLVQWPQLPVLACGMVGSAQGWCEAPYLPCPVDLEDLSGHLVCVTSRLGVQVHITPGLLLPRRNQNTEAEVLPDIMRGEEVKMLGALSQHPEWAQRVCMLMPGTHSKWAWIEAGCVSHFMTCMTGELFAVLRAHSILGRLMPHAAKPGTPDPDIHVLAFEQGVELGYKATPGRLTHLLFSVRSMALTGELLPEDLPDYLSGLLIGTELAAALRGPGVWPDCPLVLQGSAALTQRYAQALAAVGRTPTAVLDNTAPQGLWHIAQAAGLISTRAHHDTLH
jgi:2-dehydro-3-deoxygalactonokinase